MGNCALPFFSRKMMSGLILWAKEQMLEHGLWFLFLFAVTEAFIQPIPVEPVLAGGVGLHIASPEVLLLVSVVGSVLGGCIGFFLGKKYGHPAFLKLFKKNGQKWMDEGEKFFEKWGIGAVILCAFTPIPFKVAAWLAGIFEMKFWQFLVAAIIGRLPRFAIVIYGLNFFFGQ